MATVYILYSGELDKYYVGSCLNLKERLSDHENKKYSDSFTGKAKDWVLYFFIDELGYEQARNIESHIKQMKSRRFIENLKKFNEISEKLKQKYKE